VTFSAVLCSGTTPDTRETLQRGFLRYYCSFGSTVCFLLSPYLLSLFWSCRCIDLSPAGLLRCLWSRKSIILLNIFRNQCVKNEMQAVSVLSKANYTIVRLILFTPSREWRYITGVVSISVEEILSWEATIRLCSQEILNLQLYLPLSPIWAKCSVCTSARISLRYTFLVSFPFMYGCYFIVLHSERIYSKEIWYWMIPVTTWSKAWLCGRMVAGISGSKPAGDMVVCLCECCM
jgi:hypothetical protein